MEVPAKYKTALVGLRYWLLALVFMATSTFLLSCSGNETTITIVKGPDTITITVSSTTVHPGETITATVTVKDDSGLPIEGETIFFTISENNSGASLSALSALTDFNGQTSVEYTAGVTSGDSDELLAVAKSNEASDDITINVEPPLVGGIQVTSGSTSLVANGTSSTNVRATVSDVGGSPVAGLSVSFTTTLGALSNPSAFTNIDGVAEVTLTAEITPGTAVVTANGGGFVGQVSIIINADVPDSVVVTTMPSEIDPNGQTTVTATVKDGNGNPVNNETVNFSVDENESGGSLGGNLSAITNVNGQASVTYTAGPNIGTDTIEARAASNDVSGTGTVEITAGSIVVGSITVTAASGTLVADGTSTTTIRAIVRDTNNNLASSILVNFSTTAGTLVQTSDETDENGVAEVTLRSATNLGTATVTGDARGFNDSADVTFIAGGVGNVVLTANPPNINADGSSTSVISALVTDDDGNPVANGEVISFSITTGGGTLSSLTASTVNGIASVTFTSPISGTGATVRGDSTNGAFGTVNIVFTTEQVASISLTLGTTTLVANGVQSTTAIATATNTDGNPVSDGTLVTFTIPIGGGDIDSSTAGPQLTVNVPTTGGTAVAVLTASFTAGQYVMTATSGGVGQLVLYELTPGPANAGNTTLTANPTSIPADGTSTSVITLNSQDVNGNPVADGTGVNFYTDLGTLSSATGSTAFGVATVILTSGSTDGLATVTAVIDGVTVQTGVAFGFVAGVGSGTATTIELTVSTDSIRVKGSGGQESAVITATARDESGNLITDCPNLSFPDPPAQPGPNMRFTITNGPGGGEELDGTGTTTVDKPTSNGTATVALTSGTISGSVTIQVQVILDGICGNGSVTSGPYGVPPYDIAPPYAVALTTPIGIEAGEPANIVIFQPTEVIPNNDGSISMIISALVQDQYSNPVEDGTVIFFGIVDNPPTTLNPERDGYKVAGDVGETQFGAVLNHFESATFTSSGVDFTYVDTNDSLIILNGMDKGGHIIVGTSGGPTIIEVTNNFQANETDLEFVAGTAELGTVCGVVTTGNLEPDGTCTPSSGTVIKGVAHSRMTWTPQGIFKPFYLYAESVGRTVGDAIGDTYPAVAPVAITVTITTPTVLSGQQDIEVFAQYQDGGSHPIPNEVITFSSSNPLVASFGGPPPGGTSTITDTTGSDGRATTTDLDTLTCLSEQTIVTITASSGPYAGNAPLTIQATAPTADFTCSDAGDGNNADCTDTSTTPAGTVVNGWAWDIDCDGGAADSTLQNPTLPLGPGTSQVCLTVTNDAGCSSSQVSKSVVISAVPPTASFTVFDVGDCTVNYSSTSIANADGTDLVRVDWTFTGGSPSSAFEVSAPPYSTQNIDYEATCATDPCSLGAQTLLVTDGYGSTDTETNNSVSVTGCVP
jgi:adhesin/invasin